MRIKRDKPTGLSVCLCKTPTHTVPTLSQPYSYRHTHITDIIELRLEQAYIRKSDCSTESPPFNTDVFKKDISVCESFTALDPLVWSVWLD